MPQPEWMLTEEELFYTSKSSFYQTKHQGKPIAYSRESQRKRRGTAMAQARRLVEWQDERCTTHFKAGPRALRRRQCSRCMQQLREEVGLNE